MSRLEVYICGADGEAVGDVSEISLTGHELTFSNIDAGRYPLLARMSVYNRNAEFPTEFLPDVEGEILRALGEKRGEGVPSGVLTSLLCLVQGARKAARPVKIRFSAA